MLWSSLLRIRALCHFVFGAFVLTPLAGCAEEGDDQQRLGVEGASCQRTAQCESGLACVDEICTDSSQISAEEAGAGDGTDQSSTGADEAADVDDTEVESGEVTEGSESGETGHDTTDGADESNSSAADEGESESSGGGELWPVDDFEDGDADLPESERFRGVWIFVSESAEVEPLAPTKLEEEPGYALRIASSGFTYNETFAVVYLGCEQARFEPPESNDGDDCLSYDTVDLSSARGIRFRARHEPGSDRWFRVGLGDVNTDELAGNCDIDNEECYNYFGDARTASLIWQEYRIDFDTMKQDPTWGKFFPEFRSDKVYALRFMFEPDTDYAMWIDDIAFYK